MNTFEGPTIIAEWPPLKKFFFLFFLFYSFFFIFPEPLTSIPGLDVVFNFYYKLTDNLTLLVGRHILHINNFTQGERAGSADMRFDYVKLLTIFILAFIVASIVFVTSKKKINYSKLFYLLYVSVRYYLALNMFIYGFSKVFKSQFPSPALYTLKENYGDSSPIKLLWTFMGFSTGYNIFVGISEVLAGALLLFRRTIIPGAFLTLAVMANVATIDLCYDVPVKILSLHLVLFSIFLIAPYTRSLYSFLIQRKNTAIENSEMPFKTRWLKITRLVLKAIIFLIATGIGLMSYKAMSEYGDSAPKPPMYGVYKTIIFVRNRDTLKPLTTDSVRWNRIIIDRTARLDMMNEKSILGQMNTDTINHTMSFKARNDTSTIIKCTYILRKDTLIMNGTWRKDTLSIKLKKEDLSQLILINRGFHWINERNFIR